VLSRSRKDWRCMHPAVNRDRPALLAQQVQRHRHLL
jgi:hypothetical protein